MPNSSTTTSAWRLFAAQGLQATIGTGGTVYGTSGREDITVFDEAGAIAFDPSFNTGGDIIRLAGNAAAWQISASGSNVVLTDGDTRVTIPVGEIGAQIVFADGVRTLYFDRDETVIRIGFQEVRGAVATVTAAPEGASASLPGGTGGTGKVFLGEGASVTLGGDISVFGSNGADRVTVVKGSVGLDPSFNKGGDTIVLGGGASSFDARSSGSAAIIAGANLTLTAPLGESGLHVQFTDGARTLRHDGVLQTAMFGSQTVGSAFTDLEATADGAIDQVLFWNQTALDLIALDRTAPPVASRALGILGVAVHDALASAGANQSLWISLDAQGSVDIDAAVAYAAYEVLSALFPNQAIELTNRLSQVSGLLGTGASRAEGLRIGANVAHDVLALRADDGASDVVTQPAGTSAGVWAPNPPAFAAADFPQWGALDPFILDSGDQFRALAPLPLSSADYAAQVAQVKSLGAINSAVRTADQTEIALFWRDGGGTYTPPGHMVQIALIAARAEGLTTSENAVLFGMLDTALADAAVAAWDTKYTYDLWRPIQAIRETFSDGNALTVADPTWTPLFATPSHPSYVSGHSTFSAAGAAVLTAVFGDDYAFSVGSTGLPGVTREFDSFVAAAEEAGISRIYGGIHFMQDNTAGLAIGGQVGDLAVETFAALNGNALHATFGSGVAAFG